MQALGQTMLQLVKLSGSNERWTSPSRVTQFGTGCIDRGLSNPGHRALQAFLHSDPRDGEDLNGPAALDRHRENAV